jgi:hypothetical protein
MAEVDARGRSGTLDRVTVANPIDDAGDRWARWRRLRRWAPPTWVIVALSVLTIGLLYSVSVPGFDFFIGLGSLGLLLCAAAAWSVGLLWALVLRARHRPPPALTTWPLSTYAFAPVAGLVVVALMWSRAPLHVRFALSRSSFDHAVAQLPLHPPRHGYDEGDWDDLDFEGRIGLYGFREVDQVGDVVIFFEDSGDFFNDAGFAYLPHGPDPRLGNGSFESPDFTHLSGHWYSFTSSW